MNYMSLSKDAIKNTLVKLIEDPSYTENVLKWSARFRDQKEKPLDRAVWWIEWLLRNPNCDYLKSPVNRIGFIAGNAYDVIAFVILLIVVLLVILLKSVFICIRICSKKGKQQPNTPNDIYNKKRK